MRHISLSKVMVVFGLLVFAAMLLPIPSAAQDTGPKGISVSGNAEVSGTPDIARLSIGVVTEDKNAAKAATDNARQAQKIIDALLGAGIAKKDIQTSQYSVQPTYDYKEQPARLTGYQVSNNVRANIRDLKKVGDVIDRAIAGGANNIQGISFEMENDNALRNQALKQAAAMASEKAGIIAEALGVKLGPLMSASESVGRPIYPMMLARAEPMAAPETPVLPGQVTVTATVNLIYGIQLRGM
jgi:uncharacterized protein